MKKTKIFSLFLTGMMLFSQTAFADTGSVAFDNFERLANYAANLYIDETVSGDYLMDEALRKVMNEKPELAEELIKAAFSSLDEYSEFYTREEYELFKKNINVPFLLPFIHFQIHFRMNKQRFIINNSQQRFNSLLRQILIFPISETFI